MNPLMDAGAAPSMGNMPMPPNAGAGMPVLRPGMPQMPQGNPLMNAGTAPAPQPMQQITPQRVEELLGHNKTMGDMLSGLLGKSDVSSNDVLKGLSEAMQKGAVTPQQAAMEAANLPTDPQQIKQYLFNHFMNNMQMGKQLQGMRMNGGAPAAGMPPNGAPA